MELGKVVSLCRGGGWGVVVELPLQGGKPLSHLNTTQRQQMKNLNKWHYRMDVSTDHHNHDPADNYDDDPDQ